MYDDIDWNEDKNGLVIKPRSFNANKDSDCVNGKWSFWYEELHDSYSRSSGIIAVSSFIPEYSGMMRFSISDVYGEKPSEYYAIPEYAISKDVQIEELIFMEGLVYWAEKESDFTIDPLMNKIWIPCDKTWVDVSNWDQDFISTLDKSISRASLDVIKDVVNIRIIPRYSVDNMESYAYQYKHRNKNI